MADKLRPPDADLIPEEIAAQLGRSAVQELGEISLRDIQRYAVAVGETNPLYFDEEYARSTPWGGIVAPPNMLTATVEWGYGPPEAELHPDGRSAEGPFRTPSGRLMGGGTELELLAPVHPGDSLTRTMRLKDLYQTEGRSGPLVFLIAEATYTNQRGEPVLRATTTRISRPERAPRDGGEVRT